MKEDLLGAMKTQILSQRGVLKNSLIKQLKMQVPKASPSSMEQIWAVDNLGIMDMMELRQEFGDDAMNNLISGIEQLRGKMAGGHINDRTRS